MKWGLAGVVALTACARPVAVVSAPAAPVANVWSYEVVVAGGGDLDVTATFSGRTEGTFSLEEDAVPFVADVKRDAGASIAANGGIWTVPGCASGCTLHYRFHLETAARAIDDVDTARAVHGCIESPPSAWLLRPTERAPGTTYRFHVVPGAGSRFATGVHPVPDVADTYAASADDVDMAPYSVFGKIRDHTLKRADTTIEVAIAPGQLAMDDATIDHWIDLSARAIDAYYARFPVARFLLVIVPHRGHRGETVEGRTLSSGGSTILLGVSGAMTADDIPTDWVLTHEMTHLALPTLRRDLHWLEEGIATYVEPIARAKVGTIAETEVWKGLVDGLPNGEPMEGDLGLDRTHTWGRTYWGGALFAFMADLEIRKRTGGSKGLEDALRGIVAAGGNGEARWPLADVLKKGDEAVGVPVLEEMHATWGTQAVTVDLAKVWKELGVREGKDGKGIEFVEGAELEGVRKGMTKRE